MDKDNIIKYLRNFIMFVGLIALTFWIIFKDQDGELLWQTIKASNWNYILIGTLGMLVFLSIEATNIR